MRTRTYGDPLCSLLGALDAGAPETVLPAGQAAALGERLQALTDLRVYPRSIAASGNAVFFLGRREGTQWLGILSSRRRPAFEGTSSRIDLGGRPFTLQVCPTGHGNAAALRRALPFTAPGTLGLRPSVGCGDRLGLATPGHVRAVRGHRLAPVFAQQSTREMERTGRSPSDVLDAATWGVFQEGWRGGFGADADHLKTRGEVDRCAAAGFTFFTLDPSESVDNDADRDPPGVLCRKVRALPWDILEESPEGLRARYRNAPAEAGRGRRRLPDEDAWWRVLAKYGRAVGQTVRLYRHLLKAVGGRAFDLEISMDESRAPTGVLEHAFIADELDRLGVAWQSLALRFPGRFEKGTDYGGRLAPFEQALARHVEVARRRAPYKLSLHSGSDKFRIYPVLNRHAGSLVHVKTAGTTYLEAMRVVAGKDPDLFGEIAAYAVERYPVDRATYAVSADPARIPAVERMRPAALSRLLDSPHVRQVLHVTFGSVLTAVREDGAFRYRDRLLGVLRSSEEAYHAALETHFHRHLAYFDDS